MIQAISNAVVVQPIELEETTFGNIVVPDLGNEKSKTGTVVSVGPGFESQNGALIKTTLKVGDIVILPVMGFTKFEYQGKDYWLGRESDVLAKITPEGTSIEEVLAQTEVTEEEKQYLTNE